MYNKVKTYRKNLSNLFVITESLKVRETAKVTCAYTLVTEEA